jgi:hypothetical protein
MQPDVYNPVWNRDADSWRAFLQSKCDKSHIHPSASNKRRSPLRPTHVPALSLGESGQAACRSPLKTCARRAGFFIAPQSLLKLWSEGTKSRWMVKKAIDDPAYF